MPKVQEKIFSTLHVCYLKSLGFRKRSARSERAVGKLHQAVVCLSSRFNSDDDVSFTLEVRLAHEDYFHLFRPAVPFPGLGEHVMPLWTFRPKDPEHGGEKWWNYRKDEEIQDFMTEVSMIWKSQLLPLIEQTSTLGGFIDRCMCNSALLNFQPLSWALLYSGKRNEAEDIVKAAINEAPHENARQFAISWHQKLFAIESQ